MFLFFYPPTLFFILIDGAADVIASLHDTHLMLRKIFFLWNVEYVFNDVVEEGRAITDRPRNDTRWDLFTLLEEYKQGRGTDTRHGFSKPCVVRGYVTVF